MDQVVAQRQSVRDFWEEQSTHLLPCPSIDRIYDQYVQWLEARQLPDIRRTRDGRGRLTTDTTVTVGLLPPFPRYQFRALIRKLGYKGGLQQHQPRKEQPHQPTEHSG